MKLEIKGLSKEFFLHQWVRKIEGFRDVSFAVDKGECFGIFGQSGSGKSSLIRCIYRTYIPTKGEIWYESCEGKVNLATLPEYDVLKLRKEEIGYVSQFLRVVPRVSAVDVVAEPLIKRGLPVEEARAAASSLLERFLIPENLFDSYPSTFSGGELQRVNLARALITKFNLLLLDEPTASLDEGMKQIVTEMLREEKDRGATIICISHDVSFLNALADRVGVMKGGRMVEILEEVP
ncbi:MAG: phosphonate C-P lyase system protein PhnL [Candidatus Desulfofervidus sp.]|nr:phosphonate C-P lyase system protein PhnL [Candidatus Desulfofervidus sp.]